ncbi:MAG: BatA domain-containing protein [Pirellulales bacterium]|nr:BatA domain-containing protein [Pirellulales bacterium]
MSSAAALLAFGFLNWAMLGWLAAAGLPLLIHLWNRRQRRETTWAAMEFLLAALKKNSRRLQLEQWLLLAIRTLLITLLVVAVAEPYLERLGAAIGNEPNAHKVLVIDGSLSMDFRPTDRNRFARAKELATRIVEESPQGDAFTLVLLAEPPRVVVGTPAFDSASFLDEIANLHMPHGRGDLPATVGAIEKLLEQVEREYPRLRRHEVYFLTDLGRSTWLPEAGQTRSAEFRAQSRRLAERAALVVLDLGQPEAENAAITRLAATEPLATVGRTLAFDVDVHNFGRQDRAGQRVELLVDGRSIGEQTLDLPAGGNASATFTYACESPGDHVFEARLADDLLALDNRRYLVLAVRESIEVLCINGRPSGERFGGAADYLQVALSPEDPRQTRATVHAEVVTETALLERELGSYDALFLCNVAQFTSSEARALQNFLQGGGGVVLFLGEQVQLDNYNRQLLGDDQSAPRILPARLEAVVSENQYTFDALGYRHPIVSAFRGEERAGLLTTPVTKYIRAKPVEDPGTQVALAFSSGDPVIVETPRYRGRCLLVTTSADTTWNSMPLWPSYVPIVQELLVASLAGRATELNVQVGETIGSTVAGLGGDALVSLAGPDGELSQVRLETRGDRGEWSYAETLTSGAYTASLPQGTAHRFAVNVPIEESDLTPLVAGELRADVWPGIPYLHRTHWQTTDAEATAQLVQRSGLHRWLLGSVLALLVLEQLLSFSMGWRSS